ncbi:MAG: Signal peptidase-like protein [Hymenobacteraceae bacterium]|nr:Signal peptidase-like protein [Hymenobacteraceae bacterium]
MACGSCSTGGGCSPAGCGSKGSCSSGGCNRLNVFDWLSDMTTPGVGVEEFEFVEVRFKGGRKEFYRNPQHLRLTTGDAVVVEVVGGGWHVGHISLRGELVRLQMRKKKVEMGPEIKPIQHLATGEEVEKLTTARAREADTLLRGRVMANQLRLQMKLADVEMQADHSRAVFYYSAEDRVDFRDLVRKLGDDLRTRVEMRQISLRQEAGRIGGIGSCGRELCCTTWLTDFKTVSTTAARYQQLSLNPAKLAGQCGRLKCCLNYELDTYLDAIKDIPSVNRPLMTVQGEAFLQKTDIFRRLMWFGYKGENEWHRVPTARVREILEMNRRGEQPATLLVALEPSAVPEPEVAQVEGSLERLDDKFAVSGGKKKKKKKDGREQPLAANPGDATWRETREREPRAARPERPVRSERSERRDRPDTSGADGTPPRGAKPKPPREARASSGDASPATSSPSGPPRTPREPRENRERLPPRPVSASEAGATGDDDSRAPNRRRRGGRGRGVDRADSPTPPPAN